MLEKEDNGNETAAITITFPKPGFPTSSAIFSLNIAIISHPIKDIIKFVQNATVVF